MAGSAAPQVRTLTVGVYENAPKIFINRQGNADGIFPDLLEEIARRENWSIRYVRCEWEDCLRQLREGRLDLMPDVARTPEREATYSFHSKPALYSWSLVYRRPDVPIATPIDLDGRRIAVLAGSVQAESIGGFLDEYGVSAVIVPTSTFDEAFELAGEARVDAAITNKYYGELHAERYRLVSTTIVPPPLRLYFATPYGRHQDILATIDRYIGPWHDDPDSVYYDVLARWESRTLLSRVPLAYWLALAVAGAMLVSAILATLVLRKRIRQKERELAESQDKLNAILDGTDSIIYIKDRDYRLQYINRAGSRLAQRPASELIGRTTENLVGPRFYKESTESDRRVLEQGEHITAEEVEVTDGVRNLTLLSTKAPLRRDDGSIYALCGIATDISAQKETERELRVAAIVFQSQEGMFVTDDRRRVLRANDAFTRMTGFRQGELAGSEPPDVFVHEDGDSAQPTMWSGVEQDGKWQGEVRLLRKGGGELHCWLAINAVQDDHGAITHYVCALADITQQKIAQGEIARLANYDPLTNLPNRRLLMERLQHWLAGHARRKGLAALLFLDLDNFKDLNDTSGHAAGDQLLRHVADRILGCVREGDTVARLGGDEFVILLEGIEGGAEDAATHAGAIGWKIHDAVNRPYSIAGTAYHTTCSIGVTLCDDDCTQIDELMKRGDLAMYEAKRAGRNTLRFFRADMESAVRQRIALESEMREAVRNHEFVLYYQPQVGRDAGITGAEALVRWKHPERGLIGPATFIHVAEASGLIVPLGRWVLRTACEQLATWAGAAETAHLSMAVNVSAHQFRHPDFVQETLEILDQAGANPSLLKLELTETLLIENVEETIAKMRELKARGVCFALDDFGTGYSSLSYLKRLPLDQLKIDRSFVNDVLGNPNDASIARSIVALARALDLDIIAEGVETERQREFLAGLDCDAYQGYLFGRPIAAERFNPVPLAT
ncbi:EAL domain-containing protein [Pseudoduganella sp. GCM10020061]|uniref:EAL domain-containing protein n=1 Tax=Pseudoduganella sp. GCM10020061 TaxID=3317345 RepID=UPI003630D0F5